MLWKMHIISKWIQIAHFGHANCQWSCSLSSSSILLTKSSNLTILGVHKFKHQYFEYWPHIASFFKTSPAMFLKFTSQIISMALCCLCLDDKLRRSLLCLYEGHHVSSINYKLSYLRTNIRAPLSISRFMYENICLKSLPRTIYFEASTFSPAEIFPNQSK